MELLPLKNGLVRHVRRSPAFVAAGGEFSPEAFATLLRDRPTRCFVARDGATPAGYLELAVEGERYRSAAPDMRNIGGTDLLPDSRGRGLYQNLLQTVVTTVRAEGVRRIGVDFEATNPPALRFRTRSFAVYLHSCARRIDDPG